MQQQWPTIPRSDQKLKRFSPHSLLIFASIAQGKKQDNGIIPKSASSNSAPLFAFKCGKEVVKAAPLLLRITLSGDRQTIDSIDAEMTKVIAQQTH